MKMSTEIWGKRKMSLAGKISIIKSMITSKLLYCINNLPSPKESYWKEVEDLLYKFLNDGKTDKIKRSTLIGPYELGGYKMLDIRAQNEAMKLNWGVRLINNDGVWKSYITSKLPIDITYMLRSNIKYDDLPFTFPVESLIDEFWKLWSKHNYKDDIIDLEDVLNQNLWYNSHIKIGNKVVHFKKWEENGIRWVNQLITEDNRGRNRFISLKALENTTHIRIPMLEYMGLIDAIPMEWRRLILRNEEDLDREDYKLIDELQNSSAPTKLIYNRIIKTKCKIPTNALDKWRQDIRMDRADSVILNSHALQRKSIMNNVIKSYNYKFMMRTIPTGRRLFLMGKEDTENCHECQVKEDIIHLYWYCPSARRLWERLKTLIEREWRIIFQKNKEQCLLGTGDWITNNHKEEIILLCTWAKYYIHLNKCNKTTATTRGLEIYIKGNIKTERKIYMEKGWANLYQEKWGQMIVWSMS